MPLGSKKYVYELSPNGTKFIVVYEDDRGALMEYSKGNHLPTYRQWFSRKVIDRDMIELKEPRREFFNAYKSVDEKTYYIGPFTNRSLGDQSQSYKNKPRYGVLELIHHSDTKVESVFHLVGKK